MVDHRHLSAAKEARIGGPWQGTNHPAPPHCPCMDPLGTLETARVMPLVGPSLGRTLSVQRSRDSGFM